MKYLAMTLDVKLRWKAHIKMKKEELQYKFRKMYWLLGKRSDLSIPNKLLLYEQVLRTNGHMVSNYGDVRKNQILS